MELDKIVLVCRSGGGYGGRHVDWLWRQLAHEEAEVIVLTDLPTDQMPVECRVVPLKHNWPGWWSKMELFHPDFLPGESFLYIDLDTVVRRLPPDLWHFHNNLMLRDFYTQKSGASGLMLLHNIPEEGRLQPRTFEVWRQWMLGPEENMRRCGTAGDQAFISQHLRHEAWQDQPWGKGIVSYKAHVEPGLCPASLWQGPVAPESTDIICFHGEPRPWNVKASWIPELPA